MITSRVLKAVMPMLSAQQAAEYLPRLLIGAQRFEINRPEREAAFLGQLAHESGGLKYWEEIASGAFINSATYAELTIRIKRDGTEIYSSVSLYQLGGLFSISAVDTPSSGSRTYTVTVSALSASFYGAVTVSSRSMIALEAKR